MGKGARQAGVSAPQHPRKAVPLNLAVFGQYIATDDPAQARAVRTGTFIERLGWLPPFEAVTDPTDRAFTRERLPQVQREHQNTRMNTVRKDPRPGWVRGDHFLYELAENALDPRRAAPLCAFGWCDAKARDALFVSFTTARPWGCIGRGYDLLIAGEVADAYVLGFAERLIALLEGPTRQGVYEFETLWTDGRVHPERLVNEQEQLPDILARLQARVFAEGTVDARRSLEEFAQSLARNARKRAKERATP